MKRIIKVLLFVMIVFSFYLGRSQNRYIIQQDITVVPLGGSTDAIYELKAGVNQIFFERSSFVDAYEDYYFNSSIPLNRVTLNFGSSNFSGSGTCSSSSATTQGELGNLCFSDLTTPIPTSSCFEVNLNYFRFFEIPDFTAINNVSASVDVCDYTSFKVFEETCNSVKYAVEYSIGYDFNNKKELLPYGYKSTRFSLRPSNLPDLDLSKSITLWVRYTENPSMSPSDYSDGLQFNVNDCTIELRDTDPAQIVNASCNGTTDGNITLNFKTDVEENYEMRYFVYQGNSSSFPTGETENHDPNNIANFPQSVLNVRFSEGASINQVGPLQLNQDGTYRGSLTGNDETVRGLLGTGQFYVLYQEVEYDNNDNVTVKSGELYPDPNSSIDYFTINQPTPIVPLATITQATCANPNALLQFSASGGNNLNPNGTYNYEYELNGDGNWRNASSQAEIPPSDTSQTVKIRASYTVNSTTCTSEEVTLASTINAAIPGLEIDEIATGPASSNNSSDAFISFTYDGGTPGYNFQLQKLNLDSSNPYPSNFEMVNNPTITHNATNKSVNIAELEIGTYRVTITDDDGDGCSVTSDDIVVSTTPPPTIASSTTTPISCDSGAGSIEIEIEGGIMPYNYQWTTPTDGVLPIQTTGDSKISLNNITEPGEYILKVASNGNTDFSDVSSTTIPIDAPNNIVLDLNNTTVNNISCFGAQDGSIEVAVTGGTEYQYKLDFYDDWQDLTGNSILINNGGVYDLYIRDKNTTCEANPMLDIVVEEPEQITITPTVQDVSTNGGNDGAITISVSGGLPEIDTDKNYTFSWEGKGPNNTSFSSSSQNIGGLIEGRYEITVSDDNGCSSIPLEIEITQPGPLSINSITVVNQMSCVAANDAIITADVEGTSPVTFDWYRDGSLFVQTIDVNTIENLPPGEYQLFLNDGSAPNALESAIVTIDDINAITANIVATGTCPNANEGSIVINNIQGGTPGYSYSIDGNNFQPSGNFSSLNAGNYTVTVRDSNGCEMVQTDVVVDSYPEILLDNENTIVLSVSAEGRSDGAVSPIFEGGVPPFTYEWTGPNVNGTNTQDVSGLMEGNYSILVTDANGCVLNESFTITEPGELIVTASQTEFIPCSGDTFGEITAQVIGGVAPYVLEWFQQINGSDTKLEENSNLLVDLGPGSYFLRATDANGISTDSEIVVITEPDLLTGSVLSTTPILCSGEATGAVEIAFSGGTAPYEFSWSNGETTQNLFNVPAGEYTLFISDINGCYTEITAIIEAAPDALQISNSNVINVSEYNTNDGSISMELTGGAFPFDIEWTQLSNGLVIGGGENITDLAAGSYQVAISDDNGCQLTEIFEITQPDIVEETIVQPACEGDTNGSISLLVNQGNGTFTYDWSTGDTTNAITELAPGSYSVTVTGLENGPITRIYLIEYPKPVEVDLGEDQTLCVSQELALDASVEDEGALYSWTSSNGFTSNSPSINITQSGTYMVTVTSSSGCKAEGSISVDISTAEINAELAASTQAFVNETIIAVDISYPLPDKIEWIFPDEAIIVSSDNDEAQLQFSKAGEYEIGIITYRGDCIAQQTKKIIINQSDPTVKEEATANGSKLVEDFLIYPNPTNGQFTADVNMTERGNVSIKVFSLANNALIASKKERGASLYQVPFDISGLPAGVYAVLLETPYGKTLRKIIKK
ncbi:putative secreted protein (Por secretion system target) [Flavobacteriaceae bacterium MAR_2009_75]|nr:putative secreted protein (Por secretion system target) [Flavobacteriaceae bacterium MAR_2009_75]